MTLIITITGECHESAAVPHIQLNFLSTLEIYYPALAEQFFDTLTLPSLNHLECTGQLVEDIPIIASMLARSPTSKHLSHLMLGVHCLQPLASRWNLLQILEAAPHVESLIIVQHLDNLSFASKVLKPLVITWERSLLPSLKDIVYRAKQLPYIKIHGLENGDALIRMINSC